MVADTTFEDKLLQLEEWIKTHQFLPEKIEHVLVRRYLHSVHDNVEKAKKLIEHSFQLRNKSPNLFFNRDPLDAEMVKILQIADLSIGLPKMTQDNSKVILNRLIDFDPEKFHHENITKAFFMAVDHRLSQVENTERLVNHSDIVLFDMTGFSYKHITKLSLSVLRCYMKFTQEAFPVRLKQIHLMNVSSMTSKLLTIIRPFMKTEVKSMLHFHTPNSKTLYEFVPLEYLPSDYGGEQPSMEEIRSDWLKKFDSNRSYLIDDKRWRTRDNLKNTCNDSKSNVTQSFTALSID